MQLPIDADVFHLLYGRGTGPLTEAMTIFSFLGGGWGMFALAPLLFLRKTRRFTVFLITALLVTAVLVFVMKAIVQRGRPVTIFDDVRAIALDSPTDFSFPSGHAGGSFCFAVFVSNALAAVRSRVWYVRSGGTLALFLLQLSLPRASSWDSTIPSTCSVARSSAASSAASPAGGTSRPSARATNRCSRGKNSSADHALRNPRRPIQTARRMLPRAMRLLVALTTALIAWLVVTPARAEAPLCDDRGATMLAPAPQLQAPESSIDVGDDAPENMCGEVSVTLRSLHDGRAPVPTIAFTDLDVMLPDMPRVSAAMYAHLAPKLDAPDGERTAVRGRVDRPPRH